MKKALGVVSFGTSHADAELSCIRPIESAIAEAFPDREVRRAYTSRIIGRIKRQRGEEIENESEMIERLRADGFEDIVLVSTHVIPGIEYDKLQAAAGNLKVSEVLLAGEADEQWMAELLEGIAREEGRALLVMGHGTDHPANEVYARLQRKLSGNVFVACVEGERTLDAVLPELEALPQRAVALMPLMLVTGDHARNDLAGDDEGSWKSILEARGFDVRVRMQGLGSIPAVQQRYVEKARRAMQ